MIPELQANEIWLTVMEHPIPRHESECCPECRTAMGAVLIPWQGTHQELDVCPNCQRLWMEGPSRQPGRLTLTFPGGTAPAAKTSLPVLKFRGRGVARPQPASPEPRHSRERNYSKLLGRAYLALLVVLLVHAWWRFKRGY